MYVWKIVGKEKKEQRERERERERKCRERKGVTTTNLRDVCQYRWEDLDVKKPQKLSLLTSILLSLTFSQFFNCNLFPLPFTLTHSMPN